MTKRKFTALRVVALLAAGLVANAALADSSRHHRHQRQHVQQNHHHHRPHVVRSVTIFAPIYPVRRYVYPTPIYHVLPQPAPQAYWYYCPEYLAYYPQVHSCPSRWQRVAPQPPPG